MKRIPPGSSPERRRNDPQALRGRVLDAAAALFQSNGYGATTTQQIAAAAAVTHGAMHHHFPTKKALGLAVVRERLDMDTARQREAENQTQLLARIRRFFAIYS